MEDFPLLQKFIFLLPVIIFSMILYLLPNLENYYYPAVGIIGSSDNPSALFTLFLFFPTVTRLFLMTLFCWLIFKKFYSRMTRPSTKLLFILACVALLGLLYNLLGKGFSLLLMHMIY